MKHKLLNKLWLRVGMIVAVMTTALAGTAWADTYTLGWGTASGDAGTYTNFTATSGTVSDIVSFSTAKNSSQNAPAYNSNNSQLRLYYASNGSGGSITLTPATGITITGFVMKTATSPSVKYSVDNGTATAVSASNNTYTVTGISASSSLVIQNANTSNTQLQIKTIQITYTSSGATPTCETPTFLPAAGAVVAGTKVTISSTEGATIYYTTDGSTPNSSSSVYSSPIEITAATTIKAFASKSDYYNSEVATASYTIKPAVSGYTIDFENDVDAYVDWTITNIGTSNTAITAHGGSKYGANINDSGNGVSTASIQTKETIDLPGSFTCYVSKVSTNTTSSTWTLAVSEDGTEWTNVATQEAAVGITKGEWTEFTANLSGYSDVYVRLSYGSSNAIRAVDDISITMRDPNAKVTPTVTINATGITTTDIAGNTNVSAGTLAATVTSGETNITTPAVTWSSSDTGVATVNATTGAVTLIAAGTTTITATFAGNDDYTEASDTYELTVIDSYAPGSVNNPYTVAQARAAIDAGTGITGVYVTGIVSEIVTAYSSQYHNISYNISVDGLTTSDQLEVYRGKSYNGDNFTSENDIQVSDEVVVYGNLTKYEETYEFAQNSHLVSLVRAKQNPTIPSSPVSIVYGNTYTITGIVGGDATITSSNEAVATVSNQVVTTHAVGTTTITITTAESNLYNAGNGTFTLTVTAPVGQTTAPTGSAGGTIFEETFANSTGTNDDFGTTNTGDGNGTFTPDSGNEWTAENAHGAHGSAKFGSSSKNGSATTPSITATVGSTYTLTFKAAPWSSESATMDVSVEGGTISGISNDAMTAGEWNDFTASITATATSFTVTFEASKNRFFLDEVKVEAPATAYTESYTIPSSGLGTYCSEYPLDLDELPEGVKAYAVTAKSSSSVTLTQVTGTVKGGTGLVFEGTGGDVFDFTFADSDVKPSNNMLKGTLAPEYLAAGTAYGLKSGVFQPNSAGTIKANRAYLPAGTGAVKALTLVFEDDATGITHTRVITDEATIYDLTGRRLNQMQKGINIVNGKKILK